MECNAVWVQGHLILSMSLWNYIIIINNSDTEGHYSFEQSPTQTGVEITKSHPCLKPRIFSVLFTKELHVLI